MIVLSLFTSVLLVTAVFALPSSRDRLDSSIVGRDQGAHFYSLNTRFTEDGLNARAVSSNNWAGPGTFTSITGTFTVPSPVAPPGGSSSTEYAASAWVGIDGASCKTAILQTGLSFRVQNGRVIYNAWHQWFPDSPQTFSDITFATGDQVKVTVTAMSTASGTAVVENLTTGEMVTQEMISSHPLCGQDAEWIVEDFRSDGSEVPFANFGTVAFTNAEATTSAGTTEGPGEASHISDIVQNGKVITSVTTSNTAATISYV